MDFSVGEGVQAGGVLQVVGAAIWNKNSSASLFAQPQSSQPYSNFFFFVTYKLAKKASVLGQGTLTEGLGSVQLVGF
jgi:hypothetical protein